jgi:ubiquinone/menaquinone biosynthesis C-methylase UbiE
MSVLNFGSKFLDPEKILFAAGLSTGQVAADLGSGSGFYTMAAARIVGDRGTVYSLDIMESALEHVTAQARLLGVKNIKTLRVDLEQKSCCGQIAVGTVDFTVIASVMHQMSNLDNLFSEAYRILKTGGKLLIVEWNEKPGPIGPIASNRIKASQVEMIAKKNGFKSAGAVDADQYHFGLVFIK